MRDTQRERRRHRIDPAMPFPVFVITLLFLCCITACGHAGERAAQDVLHAIDQGKVVGTRGTMENFGKALMSYSMDRGGYPQGQSIQDADSVLVPAFLPSVVTTDAWGNTMSYTSDSRSFTLTSPGADGRLGNADDMVMTDGRFTQLPGS